MSFCRKCGAEIRPGNQFCTKCGTPVSKVSTASPKVSPASAHVDPPKKAASPEKSPKKGGHGLLIFILILIILLLLGGIAFGGWYVYTNYISDAGHTYTSSSDDDDDDADDDDDEDKGKDDESSSESSTEDSSEASDSPAVSPAASESPMASTEYFDEGHDSDGHHNDHEERDHHDNGFDLEVYADGSDYSTVLDPNLFRRYSSANGVKNFAFSYPTSLYYDVSVNTDSFDNNYGTNIESVTFTGTNMSGLVYSVTRRNDSKSLKDALDYAVETEKDTIYDASPILNSVKDDSARYITSGYTDYSHDGIVYLLTTITDDYVYQMRVIMPNYTDSTDKSEKGYYTECLYRLCGFSASKKSCRDFSDYVTGED